MIRRTLAALVMIGAANAGTAQVSKEEYCGSTAQVVGAIQQARLDRVPERKVAETILAGDPAWPDAYDNAIVQLTPWVYEQKMRDVRKQDLSAAWAEVCGANWDSFKDQLN
ncbi:MAG: hypothetical protein ACWA5A_04920 [Marinibacterium sp.]